jgi:hypothetical protein
VTCRSDQDPDEACWREVRQQVAGLRRQVRALRRQLDERDLLTWADVPGLLAGAERLLELAQGQCRAPVSRAKTSPSA